MFGSGDLDELRAAADRLMEEEIVEDFKWLRRCGKDT
jgi:hypothetical protein